MSQAAIILAAGQASRFGSPKQLLEINGENLVRRACKLAHDARCSPIIVVLGCHAEAIEETAFPEYVTTLHNPHWQKGMGSSLAQGISHLEGTNVESTFILLADQPGISKYTLKRMKLHFLESNTSIVACEHGKTTGPPSLFAAKHFNALSQLNTDKGGKEVFKKNAAELVTIQAPEAGWDIDDTAAWKRFCNEALNLQE